MTREEFRELFSQLNYLDKYDIVYGDSNRDLLETAAELWQDEGEGEDRAALESSMVEHLVDPIQAALTPSNVDLLKTARAQLIDSWGGPTKVPDPIKTTISGLSILIGEE